MARSAIRDQRLHTSSRAFSFAIAPHARPKHDRVVKTGKASIMPITDSERRMAARLEIVEEHIRLENQHDLEGIMTTFGPMARYDDEPWDGHHVGREAVRAYYEDLLRAMPDLRIYVQQQHATEAAVVVEVIIRGYHLGAWRGLPPTGRHVQFGLCGIFLFDSEDRLAAEKIYYDRATVLRQLGVFHEPDRMLGRIETVLMHPLTMGRIIRRKLLRRQ
jgi:steroid delta-isomerase-like uncharacterized protein